MVGWVLLLLTSLFIGACGLSANDMLLMAFKNTVTADQQGAIAGWTARRLEQCRLQWFV